MRIIERAVISFFMCLPVLIYLESQGEALTDHSIGPHLMKNEGLRKKGRGFKSTITTVFWVGEGATPDNGYIQNYSSYWDVHWMKHFGGVDSPVNRKGYLPAAFTPKENPFYVALPFAETDSTGKLKDIVKRIPGYGQQTPLTKNRWVEIRYKGKSCFGQWQDVGPFGEDDFDWVFGSATKPKNQFGEKAGLDVSPAIAGYLGIEGSGRAEWRFVEEKDVSPGPWKSVVTR
jgi:hypothetical protein